MKVGIVNQELIEIYNKEGFTFDMVKLSGYDDPKLAEVEAIVAGRMTNEQIDFAKNLKHIFIPFTGKNGYDVDYVTAKGIEFHITNVHSKFVAERALALAHALLGKITFYNAEMRKNRWGDRNFSSRVSWSSLSNQKIGIYGYGTIGKIIHSYVLPFTEDVTVYAKSIKEGVKNAASLEELFDTTDLVFIAVPLTTETEGIISDDLLAKKVKYVINIARGKVVDEDALFSALKKGDLEGYGSDVWYQYPSREKPEISPSKYNLKQFNVVMTPHCGGFADNSQELRFIDILSQIQKIG